MALSFAFLINFSICSNYQIDRYTKLLSTVRKDCVQVEKGLAGTIVISEELEQIVTSLRLAQVPEAWKKVYPSLKPLNTWLTDLVRIQLHLYFSF